MVIGIIALVTIVSNQCSGASGKEKVAGQTQARTQTVRQAQGYAYVNSDGLNIRSGPSAQSAIVTVLRRNDRVQLIETANVSGNWVKIRSGNHEGFVNAYFLRQ
jgi:uncharacterized protein YgiM (DUF1202 family)